MKKWDEVSRDAKDYVVRALRAQRENDEDGLPDDCPEDKKNLLEALEVAINHLRWCGIDGPWWAVVDADGAVVGEAPFDGETQAEAEAEARGTFASFDPSWRVVPITEELHRAYADLDPGDP